MFFVRMEVSLVTFAENLKNIRKERGFSQKEIAEKLGVSQPNYAQYETGKRNPKFETVKKIAAALGIDVYNPLITGDMTPREAMQILRAVEAKQYLQNSENLADIEQKIAHRIDEIESMKKNKHNVDTMIDSLRLRGAIDENLSLLNTEGQKKALEYVEMLVKIREYRKDDQPPTPNK